MTAWVWCATQNSTSIDHRCIYAQWLYTLRFPGCLLISTLLDVRLVLGRLEVVAGDEVGDVIVILIVVLLASLTLLLLHALVALGELAQRCERVGAELVEDTGDELG